MPRSPSVASSAGTIDDDAGKAGSQCGARQPAPRPSAAPRPGRGRRPRGRADRRRSPRAPPSRRAARGTRPPGRRARTRSRAVELQIDGRAEPRHRLANLTRGLGVDRVQVLLGQLPPHASRRSRARGRARSRSPGGASGTGSARRRRSRSARPRRARSAPRARGELSEMAFAREAPELPDAAFLAGAAAPNERARSSVVRSACSV